MCTREQEEGLGVAWGLEWEWAGGGVGGRMGVRMVVEWRMGDGGMW